MSAYIAKEWTTKAGLKAVALVVSFIEGYLITTVVTCLSTFRSKVMSGKTETKTPPHKLPPLRNIKPTKILLRAGFNEDGSQRFLEADGYDCPDLFPPFELVVHRAIIHQGQGAYTIAKEVAWQVSERSTGCRLKGNHYPTRRRAIDASSTWLHEYGKDFGLKVAERLLGLINND